MYKVTCVAWNDPSIVYIVYMYDDTPFDDKWLRPQGELTRWIYAVADHAIPPTTMGYKYDIIVVDVSSSE